MAPMELFGMTNQESTIYHKSQTTVPALNISPHLNSFRRDYIREVHNSTEHLPMSDVFYSFCLTLPILMTL